VTVDGVLIQFKEPGPTPSTEDVCRLLNIKDDELDPTFGVIATNPDEGIYAVRVATPATKRVESALAARPSDPAEGVFADPRIEAF
jgi:hypothetical protein